MDWELYRDSRQVVKIRLRKAEHQYINKEMEGCQNTSSKCKLIRNCLPRKEPGGGVLPILPYTRRLRPKGVPFSGFRYKKG